MHLTGTDNGITIIFLYGGMALYGHYDEDLGAFFFSLLDNYGFLWA